MQQLLGQARAQGQRVEVFHQSKKLPESSGMQTQHGFVQLDVNCQDFAEICLGHAKNGGFAMRVGVVRTPVAVEYGNVAKPYPGLYIGQCDLFARY